MPDVVEIYICTPGQKLEEGQMVISHDIGDKEDARADAMRRCKTTNAIARIVYYAISPSGDFKSFFSYTNPNAGMAVPKKGMDRDLKPSKKNKLIPLNTWGKFKKSLGF